VSPEELHQAIEAYLDGTIGEEEARRLAAAIREGGADAVAVRRELELTGLLGQAAEGIDDEAFARSLEERRRAERGEADFLKVLERRASRRAAWRRSVPRRAPPFLAFAAAALLAVGALALILRGPGRRPSPEAPPQARVETPAVTEAPVPPKPEPPPPPPPPPRPEPPPLEPMAPVEPPPAPPEIPEPPPEKVREPVPSPAPVLERTRPAPLLTFLSVEGQVFVLDASGRSPAQKGTEIFQGQGVVSAGPAGRAALAYADGTRLDLGAETWVREFLDPRGAGKRVVLAQGTLSAEAARQPADRPMVFVTPHAEARVVGTALRLTLEPALTLLEVREGKVRFSREGRAVDVGAGQYAVAGPGLPLAARSADVNEIVLLPQEARTVGPEWAVVRDAKASSGVALEVAQAPYKPIDHVEKRPAWAIFTFYAPAEREYRLWIRAASVATGDPWTRDMLTVEPQRAWLSRKCPFFGEAPTNAHVIDGISASPVYAWVGSHAEEGKADPAPLSVRFHQSGMQTLRLFTVHKSVKVDAIWLSTTQKARPAARQFPPPEEK
jgi:ferric-dicitrate binding protein FerR (iron transport regulator)